MTVYESDLTKFMKQFLAEHPEEVESQRKGRAIWWDKSLDERAPAPSMRHAPRSGGAEHTFSHESIKHIRQEVLALRDAGVEVVLVVGGGNIFRGLRGASEGMDRAQSDYMGMLATVINALALQDTLERFGQPTRVQSAIHMSQVAEPYIRRRAMRHLERRKGVDVNVGRRLSHRAEDVQIGLAGETRMDAALQAHFSGAPLHRLSRPRGAGPPRRTTG